ncbi:MAG: hypothetical protein Q9160_006103 [Pyrenula sp. 1 TL-2023]
MEVPPETPPMVEDEEYSENDEEEEEVEEGVEIGDETAMEIAESAKAQEPSSENFEGESGGQEATEGQSLFSNPPNLRTMRQRMFDVEDPVEFGPAELEQYWPFIDNVWVKNRTSAPSADKIVTTEVYWCRLRKPPSYKPNPPKQATEGTEGRKTRKKRIREERHCPMAMKVMKRGGVVTTSTIVRGVEKGVTHSHDLEFIDGIKRNSGIMNTARREAEKGYLPSSVFNKLWEEAQSMEDAGGKFLKTSDVRNVQCNWRVEHPDEVLRPHRRSANIGDSNLEIPRKRPGRPSKNKLTPRSLKKPESVPAPPSQLPSDTLRYPLHAREFLTPYLPVLNPDRQFPHVTLTYASSIDARISLAPGLQTAISGPESKAMTHYLRSCHDAILIGVRTAISDDPGLNCRLEGAGGYGGYGWNYQPRPIIIDPHARLAIRPDMRLLRTAAEGKGKAPWIVVSEGARMAPAAVSTLKNHGGEYLMVHAPGNVFDWSGVFRILASEGVRSVMVEGGGSILSQLLKSENSHLVDSLIVTIAPTYLGNAGVNVAPTPALQGMRPVQTRLQDIKWQPMGTDDVILCGKLKSNATAPTLIEGIEAFAQAPDHPSSQQQPTNGHMPAQNGLTTRQ